MKEILAAGVVAIIIFIMILLCKAHKVCKELEELEEREAERKRYQQYKENEYKKLETEILEEFGVSNWDFVSYYDGYITVKSRQALEKYDEIKFFKENKEKIAQAEEILKNRKETANFLRNFLNEGKYKERWQYDRIVEQINAVLERTDAYRIFVDYITSAGNHLARKVISYIVKAGDSLWKIAKNELGKGIRYTEIKKLNGLKNDTIRVGQVLKLPDK